jgi:hypothetical protein
VAVTIEKQKGKHLRKKDYLKNKKMVFMKKKTILTGLISIFLLTILTGCTELTTDSNLVIYETSPTRVRYTIDYGYFINCTGLSNYEITYDCDLPEVLKGSVSWELLYKQYFENINLADNDLIRWSIEDFKTESYKLGVTTDVDASGFMVSDLSGKNALDISDIESSYPTIYDQYTKSQAIDGTVYVNPDNSMVKFTAENILAQTQGENSFIVAKNLFIWLKENTNYQTHTSDNTVQTAINTYNKGTGDCDDLSLLYISLCRSIGIPGRFIRGFFIEKTGETVTVIPHAWVEVFVGGDLGGSGWISVECACTASSCEAQVNQNFAFESPGHLRLFIGSGSNESLNVSMSGPCAKYGENVEVSIQSFVSLSNYYVVESKELVVDNDNRYYQ